jgi:DNA polymerase I-like protein with 3'-5' exonuclease and polymerase domains
VISLDTETTGVDLHHGSKPFFVTTCDLDGVVRWWEWDVDPVTRAPVVPDQDRDEVAEVVSSADRLVLQNSQFDAAALDTIDLGPAAGVFQWGKVDDTLIAGHLLDSASPHNLTDMVLRYVEYDIEPFEVVLGDATKEARRLVKTKFPGWAIAAPDRPDMPSNRAGSWKVDTWVPRAVAKALRYRRPRDGCDHRWGNDWTCSRCSGHRWWVVLSDYANADSEATILLWRAQSILLQKRNLQKIYAERLRLLPIVYSMERGGVTLDRGRLDDLRERFAVESTGAAGACVGIAKRRGYDLALPKSGNNNSLREFCFQVLGLKTSKRTESGELAMDKSVFEGWLTSGEVGSDSHGFVQAIMDKRKRDTAIQYMDGYRRFWVPDPSGVYRLFPRLNPTGTGTLRWSSSNPNEQNISKQDGFNVRYCFGPPPGFEWWSLDYQNLELRIPAYEAGETDVVAIFDRPDDPPYYGSYHLLVADLLHPEKFREHGKRFKDVFEATWYKWIKNGNFAVIYGAQEKTADAAYRVPGAYRMIQRRFPRIADLNRRMIDQAARDGCVETIPDRSVDPDRGYPVMCVRGDHGRASPTVPLNYHIQSTAMWLTARAMVKSHEYLEGLEYPGPARPRIVMQVHDEIVFEFPAGRGADPWRTNLPKVRKLARLMESCGADVGVPTPVSATYHPVHWGSGDRVSLR